MRTITTLSDDFLLVDEVQPVLPSKVFLKLNIKIPEDGLDGHEGFRRQSRSTGIVAHLGGNTQVIVSYQDPQSGDSVIVASDEEVEYALNYRLAAGPNSVMELQAEVLGERKHMTTSAEGLEQILSQLFEIESTDLVAKVIKAINSAEGCIISRIELCIRKALAETEEELQQGEVDFVEELVDDWGDKSCGGGDDDDEEEIEEVSVEDGSVGITMPLFPRFLGEELDPQDLKGEEIEEVTVHTCEEVNDNGADDDSIIFENEPTDPIETAAEELQQPAKVLSFSEELRRRVQAATLATAGEKEVKLDTGEDTEIAGWKGRQRTLAWEQCLAEIKSAKLDGNYQPIPTIISTSDNSGAQPTVRFNPVPLELWATRAQLKSLTNAARHTLRRRKFSGRSSACK